MMFNADVFPKQESAPWPTNFPELNELLQEFVLRAQGVLADNFVGAYLTGSFALGAADLQSDCDFLVVTEEKVSPAQERALRDLHDEIPTRSGHWTHNLEGSYAPKAELETLAALGREWLYVDRGWREMQWSAHCNTADVRWTLREHGITLVGPDPHELVQKVPSQALRLEMKRLIEGFLPDLFSWTSFDNAWVQRYAVSSLSRMLYTLEIGEVTSKKAALTWAKQTLPPVWSGLIQQVIDDRNIAWNPSEQPRPGSVQATVAFAQFVKDRSLQGDGLPIEAAPPNEGAATSGSGG